MLKKSSAWRKPVANSSLDIFGQPKKGGAGEPIRDPQGSVVASLSTVLSEPNEFYSNFKQSNNDLQSNQSSDLQQLLSQLSLSNDEKNCNSELPPHMRNSMDLFGAKAVKTDQLKPISLLSQSLSESQSQSQQSSLRTEALLKKKAYLEYRSILDRQIAEKKMTEQKYRRETIETEKSEMQKISSERKALEAKYKYELMAEKTDSHSNNSGGRVYAPPMQSTNNGSQVYAPPLKKPTQLQKTILSPRQPYNVDCKEPESDSLTELTRSEQHEHGSEMKNVIAYLLDKKRDNSRAMIDTHNTNSDTDNYSDIIQSLLNRNSVDTHPNRRNTTLPPITEHIQTEPQTTRNSVFYESAVSLLKSHFEEEKKKWSARFDHQEEEMSKLRLQINDQQSKQHSTLDQLLELQSELTSQIRSSYPNQSQLAQRSSSNNGNTQLQYPNYVSDIQSHTQPRNISSLATATHNQFFNASSVSSSITAAADPTNVPISLPRVTPTRMIAPTDIPIQSNYIASQQQQQQNITLPPLSQRSQIVNNSYSTHPHTSSHSPWQQQQQQQQQQSARSKWHTAVVSVEQQSPQYNNSQLRTQYNQSIQSSEMQSIPITRPISPPESVTQVTKPDSQINSPQSHTHIQRIGNDDSECETIESDHKTESANKQSNDIPTNDDDDNNGGDNNELCLRSESVFVECTEIDYSDDEIMDISQLSKLSSDDDNDNEDDVDTQTSYLDTTQNGAKKTLFKHDLSQFQSLKNSTHFEPTSVTDTAPDSRYSTADEQDYSSHCEEFGLLDEEQDENQVLVSGRDNEDVQEESDTVDKQLQQSYDLMVLTTGQTTVDGSVDYQLVHPQTNTTLSSSHEHEEHEHEHEEEEEEEDSQDFHVHVVVRPDHSNDDNGEVQNQLPTQSKWKALNEIDRQSISSLRSAFANISGATTDIAPTAVATEAEEQSEEEEYSDDCNSVPESPPETCPVSSGGNSENESENEGKQSNDIITSMPDSIFSSFQSQSQQRLLSSMDIISEPLTDIDCRSTIEFNADDFPLLNVGSTSFITVSSKQTHRNRGDRNITAMVNNTPKNVENELESNGYYSSLDEMDNNDGSEQKCESEHQTTAMMDVQYSDMLSG